MSETNSSVEFYVTFEIATVESGNKAWTGTRHKQEFLIERHGKKRYSLHHNGHELVKYYRTLTAAREKADEIAREVKAGRASRAKAATLTRDEALAGLAEVTGAEVNSEGRDVFGCRLGTRAAAINAVLSSSPKTIKQITEASGATAVGAHLRAMIIKGHVKHGKDGYWIA